MKKGFTLIELVATITVLGIILAMVVIDTQYFNKSHLEKEKKRISSVIEENAKDLVYTDNEIGDKVNNKLQSLEVDSETDDSIEVACYIKYDELTKARLMDSDTKYPTEKGTKVITDKSYVRVSLNNNDYEFNFVYRDDDVPITITNCLN
ncbi:MAG: type II secretion system protein [Bacilli bacterium]|nr:type II secretion system protein [Bacilli bacterium]MBO6194814.1 type II secretion system protein [Bacilli bacterium]